MNKPTTQLFLGALETLPLVMAAIPFGIVFGALAQSIDLSFAVTLGMSAIVFAGASQFIAVTLLAAATAPLVIVLTVFVVNLRQMLYSANLMPHVVSWSHQWRVFLAFWLTDETFAAVSDRLNRHPGAPNLRWFYLGSALFMYSFWLLSTIIGFTLGEKIPGLPDWGLDVAMIVAFIGIVVPALRSRADWCCAAVASVSSLLTYQWPNQMGLLFSALVAIIVALFLSREVASHE